MENGHVYNGFTMIYPFKMVVFHRFLYVYQRVGHLPASLAQAAIGRGTGTCGSADEVPWCPQYVILYILYKHVCNNSDKK